MSEQRRVDSLIADAMPVLEEFADTCETITRSVRCISLLLSARVEPHRIVPHLETVQAAIAQLEALRTRVEALGRGSRG